MWNSGMMLRQRSAGVSASVARDVARPRRRGCAGAAARSSAARWCPRCAAPARRRPAAAGPRLRRRAARRRSAVERERAGRPRPAASQLAGSATPSRRGDRDAPAPSSPVGTISALALQVVEVELELVGAVGRVERRGGGAAGDGDEGRRHLRPVRQHDRDPVAAADAERVQASHRLARERAQAAEGERGPLRRADRRGVGRAFGNDVEHVAPLEWIDKCFRTVVMPWT